MHQGEHIRVKAVHVALCLGGGGAALELELAAVHHAAEGRQALGTNVLAAVLDARDQVAEECADRALVADAARHTLRDLE